MGKRRHEISDFDLELGAHLRQLRLVRGLSLSEVARGAALSHSFLSQVERGQARPSSGSLDLIARALGGSRAEVVAAASARSTAASGSQPGVDAGLTVAHANGASTVLHQVGSPFTVLRIEHTGTEPSERNLHAEPEVVYVLRGRAEVRRGDEPALLLEAGQSVVYPGGTPHRWRAVDDQGFEALLVKQNPLGPGGAGNTAERGGATGHNARHDEREG
ncbi:XRE family transcriptional regulator [soil metagenome]